MPLALLTRLLNALRTSPVAWRVLLVAAIAFALSLTLWSVPLDYYDHALFRQSAAVLKAGGLLYRDVWDIKQPGIYAVHLLGSHIDGLAHGIAAVARPSLVAWQHTTAPAPDGPLHVSPAVASGVHLLTSAALAATAAAAAWLGWLVAPRSLAWLAVGLLSVLPAMLRADFMNYAQVEMLVSLPVVLTLALLVRATRLSPQSGPHRRDRIVAAAGACAGATALFKLVLCAVPCLFIAIALVPLRRTHGNRAALRAALAAALGFAAVLLAATLPFVLHGTGAAFVHTQTDWAAQATAQAQGAPLARLVRSARSFMTTAAWLLAPAAWAVWSGRRAIAGLLGPVGLALACLLAWLPAGALLFLIQRFSWWTYHVVVLWTPLALLAGFGLSLAWAGIARRPAAGKALAAALALTVAAGIAFDTHRHRRDVVHEPAELPDSTHYLERHPRLRALIGASDCRSAVAWANTALLIGTGLVPATPLAGDLAGILLPGQWQHLDDAIRARRPRFLVRYADHDALVREHAPALMAWIDAHYTHVEHDPDEDVDWYAYTGRDGPATPARSGCDWVLSADAAATNARTVSPNE